MMVGGAEIGLEHAFELGGDGATHQHQRIDRKEGILTEFRDVVAPDKSFGLERLVFRLVLDPAERVERRHVARRLVDAPKQNRDVFKFHAGAPLDPWNGDFRQISVRAAEIELEFNLQGHVGSPVSARDDQVWWSLAEIRPPPVFTVLKTNCQTFANLCWSHSLRRGLFGAEYLSRMERKQRFPGTILAERVPDGLESRKCDGMPLKRSRVRWPARSA